MHCVGDSSTSSEKNSSSAAADQKCCVSKSRRKNWQQSSLTMGSLNHSLSRGISFELESSLSVLTVDEPGTSAGRRRGSLLQNTSSRRGSTLHGQISTTSESSSSSSSSSERRRSSCLSDVSVRSSSSKRSSTGDFSSELEDYFDNVTHRSLQTAVIEEEVAQELHDGSVCIRPDHLQPTSTVPASKQVSTVSGQNLLEHFVDNLINEAAQQSKVDIEQHLTQTSAAEEQLCRSATELSSECVSRLDQYATHLADDIVTSALEVAVVKEKQRSCSGDVIRPSRHPAIRRQITDCHCEQQRGRRFERQQTVSGFRDAVLSDFDNKLMSSHIAADGPVVTFTNSTSKKRRSSEPANLNYTKNSRIHRAASPSSSSSSSSTDYREIIAAWFTSLRPPVEHSAADVLSDYVQNIVLHAFVESVSSLKPVHRRHQSSSKSAVPDAVLLYADHLTGYVLQAAWHELRTAAVFSVTGQQSCLQSVAETFARSIVDDALAVQSSSSTSSSQRLLVSDTKRLYRRIVIQQTRRLRL